MANYSEARKNANKNWDSKNLDRISIALPKGSKDALKASMHSLNVQSPKSQIWTTCTVPISVAFFVILKMQKKHWTAMIWMKQSES